MSYIEFASLVKVKACGYCGGTLYFDLDCWRCIACAREHSTKYSPTPQPRGLKLPGGGS